MGVLEQRSLTRAGRNLLGFQLDPLIVSTMLQCERAGDETHLRGVIPLVTPLELGMAKTSDPREIAQLYRRLARVPTSGGHRADRELLALAEKLDGEATASEQQCAAPPPTHDQLFDFRR